MKKLIFGLTIVLCSIVSINAAFISGGGGITPGADATIGNVVVSTVTLDTPSISSSTMNGTFNSASVLFKSYFQEQDGVYGIITDTMTSDTTPSPSVITTTSPEIVNYAAWMAFDRVADQTYGFIYNDHTPSVGAPVWITYDTTKSFKVDRIDIEENLNYSSDIYPENFTFQGSNNGSDWTVLYSTTGLTASWWETPGHAAHGTKSFTFTKSTAFRYFKLNITKNTGGLNTFIIEISIYGNENLSGISDSQYMLKQITQITNGLPSFKLSLYHGVTEILSFDNSDNASLSGSLTVGGTGSVSRLVGKDGFLVDISTVSAMHMSDGTTITSAIIPTYAVGIDTPTVIGQQMRNSSFDLYFGTGTSNCYQWKKVGN